jgi:hypothetical protein
MPRWASRITQLLNGVRIERLQDISEADALSEGVTPSEDHGVYEVEGEYLGASPRESYFLLWDAINGQGAAYENPFVLVYEYQAYADAARAAIE